MRSPVKKRHQVAALQGDWLSSAGNPQPTASADDHVELGRRSCLHGHAPRRGQLAAEAHSAAEMDRRQYVTKYIHANICGLIGIKIRPGSIFRITTSY